MTDERRAEARQVQNEAILVDVSLIGEKPIVFECSAKDLSPQGVRLHGEQLLKLNSQVDLLVRMPSKQENYRLTGVVKWITETTEKEHLAGIQLSDNIHTDVNEWKKLF